MSTGSDCAGARARPRRHRQDRSGGHARPRVPRRAVRAAVRSAAHRDGARRRGGEPVAVDLGTGHGLAEASRGAAAVYHLAPNVHPDEVGMAERVCAAAERATVGRLVFHSVLNPDDLDAAPRAQGPGRGRRPSARLPWDGAAPRGLPPEPARRGAPGPYRGAARPRRAVHQRRPRRRRRGRGPRTDRARPRRPAGPHDLAGPETLSVRPWPRSPPTCSAFRSTPSIVSLEVGSPGPLRRSRTRPGPTSLRCSPLRRARSRRRPDQPDRPARATADVVGGRPRA